MIFNSIKTDWIYLNSSIFIGALFVQKKWQLKTQRCLKTLGTVGTLSPYYVYVFFLLPW